MIIYYNIMDEQLENRKLNFQSMCEWLWYVDAVPVLKQSFHTVVFTSAQFTEFYLCLKQELPIFTRITNEISPFILQVSTIYAAHLFQAV